MVFPFEIMEECDPEDTSEVFKGQSLQAFVTNWLKSKGLKFKMAARAILNLKSGEGPGAVVAQDYKISAQTG